MIDEATIFKIGGTILGSVMVYLSTISRREVKVLFQKMDLMQACIDNLKKELNKANNRNEGRITEALVEIKNIKENCVRHRGNK